MKSVIFLLASIASTGFAQGGDIWSEVEGQVAPAPKDTVSPPVNASAVPTDHTPVVDTSSAAETAQPTEKDTASAALAADTGSVAAPRADTIAAKDTTQPSTADTVQAPQSAPLVVIPPPPILLPAAVQDSSPIVATPAPAPNDTVRADTSVSRKALLGPVKVSRVLAIDEMKGRYRSPKRALFMSLVVPGSGQAYIGGSKWTWARAAGYFLIDVGLAVGWYHYSVTLYNRQVRKYKAFARSHYSLQAYEQSMHEFYNSFDDVDDEKAFRERYLSGTREQYCSKLYGDAGKYGCSDLEDGGTIQDAEHLDNIARGGSTLGGQLDSLSSAGLLFDEDGLFALLGSDNMVMGWLDADSVMSSSQLALDGDDYVKLAASADRSTYLAMRDRANDLADMQIVFLGGMLLNHIVSSLDAALTARANNRALYQEDVTWLDRTRLQGGLDLSQGTPRATMLASVGF